MYSLIRDAYQSTGIFELSQHESLDEAKDKLNKIAAAREIDGYEIDWFSEQHFEATHDNIAEPVAYYIRRE